MFFIIDFENHLDGPVRTKSEQLKLNYSKYYSRDSIGNEILVFTNETKNKKIEIFKRSEKYKQMINSFPSFVEINQIINRINDKELREYYKNKVK